MALSQAGQLMDRSTLIPPNPFQSFIPKAIDDPPEWDTQVDGGMVSYHHIAPGADAGSSTENLVVSANALVMHIHRLAAAMVLHVLTFFWENYTGSAHGPYQ